jgi:hypothetical protein
MKVTVDPHLASFLFIEVFHQCLNSIDFRVEFLIRLDPLAVQVDSRYGTPIIPAHNTIWIEGWNEDKGIEFSEKFGFLVVRTKEVVYAFEYKATWSFGSMDS